MSRTGFLPPRARGCICESPALDSLGTIFLDNDGTYRVRYCQRCGGAYASQRDAEPIPANATLHAWRCPACHASNITPESRGCTNCPWTPDAWRCRHCASWNSVTVPHCSQCRAARPRTLVIAPDQ